MSSEELDKDDEADPKLKIVSRTSMPTINILNMNNENDKIEI